ncbi:hypothetical protein QQZ08_007323 [Neonectria magnoliae]|uniref:Uncharacterized protein n=1 Tax=Neonectria magnoliae TaxID=2732573 RepID=A0ABR1HZM7_9HYPO
MCHTVIAQRMCQVCQRNQGETVIDFTRCARKCSSPFYCLTPTPQMEVCGLCAATTLSTPVLARHGPATASASVSPSASVDVVSGRPLYDCPFTQAVSVRTPEVGRHAA